MKAASPPYQDPSDRPAPLGAVLAVTFLGSVSGGVFWAAIFFVTTGHYGFSPTRNLVLAAVMGAIYSAAARAAGPLSRASLPGVSPRRVLVAALGLWTVAALVPFLGAREELMWIAGQLGAGASAVVWPVVESYLAAGRHGARMRAAIGWFNVTWTPATALALLLLPVVSTVGGPGSLITLALSAVGSAAALAAVAALPGRPGRHAPEAAETAVGPEYRFLVRAAGWLLPMSYVLCSALAPILPHRLQAVGGGVSDGAIAALWMVARFITLFVMWRTGFWHGRWGTLTAAAVALAVGLGLVLLGSTLAALAVGLLIFGTGMGLTYYATLYYSMAVGHGAVDAGGTFEALIGVGYLLGPLLGLAARAGFLAAHADEVTAALCWLVTAVAASGALRPYLAARRARG